MKLGKIKKDKPLKQLEVTQEEEIQKKPTRIIKEEDIDLPDLKKLDKDSNLAKSTQIKAKRKGKYVLLGVGCIALIVGLGIIKGVGKKEVEVTEVPNEVTEHTVETTGSTDVSGLISLDKRNESREELTFVDDYINMRFTYYNDYYIREMSSEGINVIRETLPVGEDKYSLLKNTLTGVVPVIEMKNKQYTNYTILMQINNVNDFLTTDLEYLSALQKANEAKEKKRQKNGKDKSNTNSDASLYGQYANEKVDYLNYCPIKVFELKTNQENSPKDSDKVNSIGITEKDTENNIQIKEEKINKNVKDKNNQKQDNKTTADKTVADDYELKTVTVPCDSYEYLQSRTAIKLPVGYTVLADNTLEHKQQQLVTQEPKQIIVNEEKPSTPDKKELDSTELDKKDQMDESEEPITIDSEGNEINKTTEEKIYDLFADIDEESKAELETLDKQFDYYSYTSDNYPVNVHSLLLQRDEQEIKYYEFRMTVNGNEIYFAVYGEIDNNINYILEDMKILLDSIMFG